jgi:hypothetical protein
VEGFEENQAVDHRRDAAAGRDEKIAMHTLAGARLAGDGVLKGAIAGKPCSYKKLFDKCL